MIGPEFIEINEGGTTLYINVKYIERILCDEIADETRLWLAGDPKNAPTYAFAGAKSGYFIIQNIAKIKKKGE